MNVRVSEEHTKPVMKYIRDLERKVVFYRSVQRRFDLMVFSLGFASGAVSWAAFWYILQHR